MNIKDTKSFVLLLFSVSDFFGVALLAPEEDGVGLFVHVGVGRAEDAGYDRGIIIEHIIVLVALQF
jgi:hypothetical protein